MNPSVSIVDLERFATQYFSANPSDRQYAAEALDRLCGKESRTGSSGSGGGGAGPTPDESPLLLIFSESTNQYALFYAAQAMVQWTRVNASILTQERRLMAVQRVGDAMRRLTLLSDAAQQQQQQSGGSSIHGSGVPKAVIKALISCYAKLMKFGFEKEPYMVEATQYALQIHASASCHLEVDLGLELLEGIVSTFSAHDSSKVHNFMNFTCHRRCSNNFRDQSLQSIFLVALDALRHLLREAVQESQNNGGGDPIASHSNTGAGLGSPNPSMLTSSTFLLPPQHPHIEQTVLLVQRCLSYDFMGILVDETEDALSSQYPAPWRELLLTDELHLLLWDMLNILPLPHCTVLMRGLASLSGVRRTFFENPEDRQIYLNRTFSLFHQMLMQRRDDRLVVSPSFLNEVAEACGRFVSPFGYRDLHIANSFFPWLTAIKDLTLELLQRPIMGGGIGMVEEHGGRLLSNADGSNRDFSSAITVFLNFWGRLFTSHRMYSTNNSEEKDVYSNQLMEEIGTTIVMRFFETRLLHNRELTEDTKMLTDAIVSQCESITLLCLSNAPRIVSRISDFLTQQVPVQVLCSESPGGVMWLFYAAGCFVRSILANVEEGAVQAESVFFRYVVECAQCRLDLFNSLGNSSLADDVTSLFGTTVELALTYFLHFVQIVLTGERLHHALQLTVTEVFSSPVLLFQFLLTHTGNNILRRVDESHDENLVTVMKSSIDIIAEACSQIHSLKLTEGGGFHFDLPPVVDLPLSHSIKTYRLRTNIYQMLWPLRMPQRYSLELFNNFLGPIEHCINQTLSGNANNPSYIAGWMRDLRGVARAVMDHPEAKSDLVAWFCDRAPSFHVILNGPAGDSSTVIIAFLRFTSDLLSSKHGRHSFDRCSHSANGLLLFKLMCGFIQHIVERCITDEKISMVTSGGPTDGAYEVMLKPLSLCMGLLRIAVNENFVPFGAMWFYQDDTYDNTLLGLLRMLTIFPDSIFREYTKVSNEILRLIRGIADEQVYQPVSKLSTEEVQKILNFVIARCEDVDTPTGQLLNGLAFLAFIADLIHEVKDQMNQQFNGGGGGGGGAAGRGAGGGGGSLNTTPPRSPAPSSYYVTGPDGQNLSLSSGTPAGGRHTFAGNARTLRSVRGEMARLLEPMQGLWPALIRVGMQIIVFQDRGISKCCEVVYPIFEVHPPFWFEFVEEFVFSYPVAKQAAVRDALAVLSNGATSSEAFFSEVFSFRQKMREI